MVWKLESVCECDEAPNDYPFSGSKLVKTCVIIQAKGMQRARKIDSVRTREQTELGETGRSSLA